MYDYHLHSDYSEDSNLPMELVCLRSIEKGLKGIALTDHMDLEYPSSKYKFEIRNINEYIADIDNMKAKYENILEIRRGIEIGLQPHVLDLLTKLLQSYSFDFIIGSVHNVDGLDPYEAEYYMGKTKEQSFRLYYEEMLELIKKFDLFNVLGHLDYIKRYSPFPYDENDYLIGIDVVEEILKVLISKGRGIEVNTSGYRHISKLPMPHPKVIKLYRELGGEIITLGSDAHNADFIGYRFSEGLALIKDAGFSYITTFSKGEPCFIKI